jgi:hypothetical protein
VALTNYLTLTQALLQNPAAPAALYDPTLLTTYINQARVWAAGDSQSIKAIGSYSLTIGTQGPYPFTSITLTGATGVAGVLNVRQQWYAAGSGKLWVRSRSWPWYSFYWMNSAAPSEGPPREWAQYGEGENGTIYVGPTPDYSYAMTADCVCYPIALVDDTTVEALPPPWTIAIPYYAAYLALLSAQTGARVQDADRIMKLYQQFIAGARQHSTSEILPGNFPQQQNQVRQNQLGQGQGQGGSSRGDGGGDK